MTKEQFLKVGGASALAAGALFCFKPVSAGSIDLSAVANSNVQVTLSPKLDVDGTAAAMFDSTGAAWMPKGGAGDTVAKASPLSSVAVRDIEPGAIELSAASPATAGAAGSEAVGLSDTLKIADVPIPPAILLLSSAVLGLAVVARREKLGS